MINDDHPARRPTRYHWAAGTNPLHWGGALLGWAATLGSGLSATFAPETSFLTPLLAAATLCWSGIWLLVMPINPRFKRAVDAQLLDRFENDFGYQVAALSDRIDQDLYGKVMDIKRLRDRAREILKGKFGEHDVFAKDNLEKLDKLAISFLQLLVALSEYDEYLSLVDPESIKHELEAARTAANVDDETLRDVRQRQVELLNNRLTRYQRASARLALLQAQCRNVETTMKLLIDQAMTAPDAQRVSRDIDEVLSNIRESETLTQELATYDDLERELDDIHGRELENHRR
ncbi:hypothetical protein JW859_05100 [bacterium]|nr:hypothetical protein [bacterium]